MSFLQPWMLFALPLVALPIVIHLINRQRYRTVPWAAMMFLLKAQRLERGMARLRYWLIMLLRMVAVAAMLFAASRPLVSERLGGFQLGGPEMTLVVLDRSASMEAKELQTDRSKRSVALEKLADLLSRRQHGKRLALLDSGTGAVRQLDNPAQLAESFYTRATAAGADLPGLLEQALSYLQANEAGRVDLWICSDLSASDWDAASGRWTAIRESLAELKGVQLYLLAYGERPQDNLSIRVENVRRRQGVDTSELVLDVTVRAWDRQRSGSVLVTFEINQVRSLVELELASGAASLTGHRIPVGDQVLSGWGSVEIPPDSQPADNRYYFAFAEPPVRQAAIVTDDSKVGDTIRLGLEIPSETGVQHAVEVVPASRAGAIDWEELALLVWQASFPAEPLAGQIRDFVDSGRAALIFPPERVDDASLFDARWSDWQALTGEEQRLTWWRGDTDLLARTAAGDPLPLQQLRIFRHRQPQVGSAIPLAWLEGERPLLVRSASGRGHVYFWGTLPMSGYSTLEQDAVAFYVMLQRALTRGSKGLLEVEQLDAGFELQERLATAAPVAPVQAAPLVSERGLLAGVYRRENRWLAINRSPAEDDPAIVSEPDLERLFQGLSWVRIDDQVADQSLLASEIWRLLLVLLAVALVLEAFMCLPDRARRPASSGEV